MLKIEEVCKTLQKSGAKYTQEQVKKILNLLYQFAEIAFFEFKAKQVAVSV